MILCYYVSPAGWLLLSITPYFDVCPDQESEIMENAWKLLHLCLSVTLPDIKTDRHFFFFPDTFMSVSCTHPSSWKNPASSRCHLFVFVMYGAKKRIPLKIPRREAGDVWCLPPVWNLRAAIWFHFAISSLVLLPRPVTLSVLSFSACWPFLLNFFQKILQYFSLRDRLFCMAPV